jgi:cbb3-type cytochrome oxidase subunit 1
LVTAHFLVGASFLVLGSVLQVLSLMSLRFADLFPVTFGRLEPLANLSLVVGFVGISLTGGVYYVLPRLTGTRLWRADVAQLGLWATTAVVAGGLVLVFLGLGSGRAPFGLPWWASVPLAGVMGVPALVTLGTVSRRVETHSYVTLWFVIAGVIWLPLLFLGHLAGELPSMSQLGKDYSSLFLSSGFVTMFLFTVGTGLIYFTVVRELDIPLASRQLAFVGLWSLGFASVWWGTAQLLFGPGPGWLSGVGAALGLAFPIGALANAANVSLTLEGSWDRLPDEPAVASGLYGLYLGVGVSVLAALAGFRSVASAVSLTAFWEAIEYASLSGVAPLLGAGVVFAALPRVAGRVLYAQRFRSFTRLTLTGSVGTLVFLLASGVVDGFSWIAGSNSAAYVDAGEGWGAGAGATSGALLLIAVVFSVVAMLGHLSYAGVVFGTVTRGAAAAQEVLVARDQLDE